jgi:hypothetical protein
MRTTDLFKNNRSSKRLNESLSKTFGTKLDLESFDTPKLEDARNKLRTQIHTARQESGFNETIENETLTQAQFMHDAIVAELMDREEHIVDTSVQEAVDSLEEKVQELLQRFEQNAMEIGGYGDPDIKEIVKHLENGDAESAAEVVWYAYADQDGGEFPEKEPLIDDLQAEFEELVQDSETDDDEGGETDDNYALASAGFGSDEDYESVNNEGGRDAYQRDYDSSVSGMGRRERENDEGDTEPANNFAVSINGKQWKVFKGRGYYADDDREKQHYRQLKDWAAKKSESTGKKWTVSITGENPTESIDQKEDMNTNEAYINNARDAINLLADIRKQSKMAELGQGDPVRPNQLVNDLYDVMQWIEANMKESVNTESVNTGDIMTRLQEGEVQQASAIVTAKTMVDRVSRWIEELSSMENDTLLQLGDSIRDEMGQEQAKAFISSVAPAIQQALENLKSTRETMATGVRQLTGEEQGAEMLGGEPAGMGGDEMGPAEPDAMNMGDEMGGEDEFAAAEPAAGGLGDAGREQRESINRSSSLLKVLAG